MAIPQAIIGGEMRIIKEGAKIITAQDDGGEYGRAFSILDTIEITDAGLNEIHKHYHQLIISQHHSYPFPQYLKELISLTGEGK
jgi:hypothetical protein